MPQFSVNPQTNVPYSVGNSADTELQEMQERISAIRKPYPGAPIIQVSRVQSGFNFGQAGQSIIPQFFSMGSSNPSESTEPRTQWIPLNPFVQMGEKSRVENRPPRIGQI